jgi:beta-glucanase (GH16 family)
LWGQISFIHAPANRKVLVDFEQVLEMKKAKWFFLALALIASSNCRVNGDGLSKVAELGTGDGGALGAGGAQDSRSATVDAGGLGLGGAGGAVGSDGATSSGGTTSSGGAIGLDGATSSGGTAGAGGATGFDGAANKGGATSSGGAADSDAASISEGGTVSGGTLGSGGTAGAGGAGGAGGSPGLDVANDRTDVPIRDVAPEALADVAADVPADVPENPADAKDAVEAASPDNRPPMTLVWSDEFNGLTKTGVNPAKWSYVTWGPGQVNNEAQAYTSRLENVFQDGAGNLVIRALNTPFAGNAYTSGRIESNGHFSFNTGRVEVRAKLPKGIGSFPGIIGMGTVGTWPQCGELALMEQYGQDKSWFYVAAHAGSASGSGDTGNVKYTFASATTASADFHVYSVDWYADHIVFQVDGIEITRTTFTASSPFYAIPEYLILDLALGGGMGGTIDNNAFPMDMMVDYVRVYSF